GTPRSSAAEIKAVIVGDGGCGKTSLLMVFARGDFPKWYPEVNHFCKGVPVLLVGCKTDLRQDPEVLRELRQGRQEPITSQQGEAMARQVHAVSYFECSARYQENVRDIFAATCATALRSIRRPRRRRWTRRGCTLS
uniref:Ras homolog family member D n=1 Tax=Anas platyrhynchos platyrhynchos TaxID=8840 RepID=A0A493SUM4_ANAPP